MDATRHGESLRQLERVTSRLPVAFYQSEVGEHGRWRYVSPQIERMLGYPAQEWIDDRGLWARQIHPDDRGRALRHEHDAWGKGPGSTGQIEYRMTAKDGRTVWIRDEGVVGDDGYIDGVLTDVTERRGAEERFRRLLEATPDPMVIADEQGTIRLVNREVERVLGYEPEELIGERVEVLVPDGLRGRHAAHRGTFMERPQTRSMGSGLELCARRKDGSELPVEISLSPMESGGETLIIAALRDVSRQRAAEQERRKLAEISAQLPFAFYRAEFGKEGRWRFVSPQIEGLIGLTAEHLLADPGAWASAIHPDDRESVLAEEQRDAKHGPGYRFAGEYRMVTTEGEIRWIRDEGIVVEGHQCEGVLTDITTRKQAEERFRSLLEAAPDPMVIVDESGTIALVNHEVENVLGYSRDELVGRPVEVLIPEGPRVRHVSHRAAYAREMDTRPMGTGLDLNVRRKDGSELPVEISLSPMSAEEGTLVIAAIRDVTKQREAERMLRHLAEHDPLTGLHNRRRFEEELERTVAAANRYGTPAAVLVLDVDQFKQVNDRLGHAAGDEMLVKVAEALRNRLRETDMLARLGGDEIAAIATHVEQAEARTVAEALLEAVRSEARLADRPDLEVTVSIGVALIGPGCTASPERLLSQADIAMYAAKRAGRDRYAIYGEGTELRRPTPGAAAPAGGLPPSA